MMNDRPVFGILLMLGFCILMPLGDAFTKLLGPTMPVGQVVLFRFVIQLVLLAPVIWLTGRAWRMNGRVLSYTIIRALLQVVGIAMMFSALKYLPLADAVAIAFVMPFIMLLLGKLFLNEEVGKRRIIACTVGFFGTMLVIQPSFANVGWPALLPLFVALDFALFMLVTRKIAKETDPITLQAVSGAIAIVIMIPILATGYLAKLDSLILLIPTSYDWSLLIGVGIVGTVAHLMMTWSLRYAPSTTLAPMQYLEIIFAAILGYLIFDDLPNAVAAVGIVIVMAAGFYVILREQAIARNLAP